eukprot:gene12908-14143_t
MGGYIVLTPKNGLITSTPTVRPSSRPSSTPQPSLIPTIVTTSQVTSYQPFLSNTSMFPTNIGSLTISPSHRPTTSMPSRVPTRNPSLSPTFRQSKLKTVAPTSSPVPTVIPTYRRSSVPSQVPTVRPTTTIAPSYTMTRSPSIAPTLPLPPSVIVSSLTANITTITGGGVYSTSSQSKCCSSCAFLISSFDDVTIIPQDNDGCNHHYYKILPLKSATSIARQGTLVIKSFSIMTDVIDLTAFSYLHNLTEVSYSNNPVTLLLFSSSSSEITQRVLLPSLLSFDSLTASNFIFTSSSSNEGTNSVQLFTRNLITAFAFSALLIGMTVLYAFSDRIIMRSKNLKKMTKQDTNISFVNRTQHLYEESPNNRDHCIVANDIHHIIDISHLPITCVKAERQSARSSKHGESNSNSSNVVDSDSSGYNISNYSDDNFDSFSDDEGSISNLTL